MDIKAVVDSPTLPADWEVRLLGEIVRMDAGDLEKVELLISVDEIWSYMRRGDDLVMTLANGEQIILENFFRPDSDGEPTLRLLDSVGEYLVDVNFVDHDPGRLQPIIEESDSSGGILAGGILPVAVGVGALGGLGLILSGGGDNDDGRPDAPKIDSVTDDNGDGRPEVSGTGTPGNNVIITWPDGNTSETEVKPSGDWDAEAPDVQPDGDIVVEQVDPNGDVSPPAKEPYDDDTDPKAPDIVEFTDENDNGKPEAHGTAEPKSTVTVTWVDGSKTTALTDDQGNWSSEASAVQEDGDVTAYATDINGNNGPSDTLYYQDGVDPRAPTLTVTDANDNDMPEAQGTAEPKSTVTVTWPNEETSTAQADPETGKWSVESPTTQPPGDVAAVATDINGNTSPEVTAPWDGGGGGGGTPDAPTINPITDEDRDGKPEASGTGKPGNTIEVTWPDGSTSEGPIDESGNWQVEAQTVQKDGTVEAVQVSPGGNEGPPVEEKYDDQTPPQAPEIEGFTDANENGMPEVHGTAEPKSTVTVTWVNGPTTTAQTDDQGNWSSEASVVQERGDVTAFATDVNGNKGPSNGAYYDDIVNPEAPTLTLSDGDNDGKPEASGISEPQSTVTVTWVDNTTSTATADATTGQWSVESPTGQPEGEVTAYATDLNDNDSASVAAVWDGDISQYIGEFVWVHGEQVNNGPRISVYEGGTDGTFSPSSVSTTGIPRNVIGINIYESSFLADVTGDGLADWVFGKQQEGKISVFEGQGDGSFSTAAKVTSGFPTSLSADWAGEGGRDATYLKDVTGDGVLDWVHGDNNYGPPRIVVYEGQGDGTFSTSAHQTTGFSSSLIAGFNINLVSLLEDVTGNGNLDWVFGRRQGGKIDVYEGQGDGTFSTTAITTTGLPPQQRYDWAGESAYDATFLMDVTGDHILDWVHGDQNNGRRIVVYEGLEGGKFSTTAIETTGFSGDMSGVNENDSSFLMDVTGNGTPDWIFGKRQDGAIDVYEGHGDGRFSTSPITSHGFPNRQAGDWVGEDGTDATFLIPKADLLATKGSAGADFLIGADGADRFLGLGGADTIHGWGGDDIIVVPDATFHRIDGGAGTDTLQLDGIGIDLDFANGGIAPGTVTGMEKIDINGSGANTLTVGTQEVLDLSDTTDTLIVNGGTDDTVNASGFTDTGTSNTIGAINYDIYSDGGATLWVEQSVGVVV